MRLLLDQGLPRSAAAILTTAGHEVEHVAEIGLSTARDSEIIDRAHVDGSVVVTLDANFHALVALSGQAGPSVIRVRVEGLRGEEVAAVIDEVVGRCREELEQGALVSVSVGRLGVRRLPMSRDD